MTNILQVSASIKGEESTSRQISLKLIDRIKAADPTAKVVERDTNDAQITSLTGETVAAYFTPPADRSDAQKEILSVSDKMVEELLAADVIVIGTPMYNFSAPSTLKAWIDLIARAGVTFQYTENGPVGLVKGKKAYVVCSTGGVPVNSPADFLTPYLKQFLGFLGITDVEVIEAAGFGTNPEEAMAKAVANVEAAKLPAAA